MKNLNAAVVKLIKFVFMHLRLWNMSTSIDIMYIIINIRLIGMIIRSLWAIHYDKNNYWDYLTPRQAILGIVKYYFK